MVVVSRLTELVTLNFDDLESGQVTNTHPFLSVLYFIVIVPSILFQVFSVTPPLLEVSELRTALVTYLFAHGKSIPKYLSASLSKLVCAITKRGWSLTVSHHDLIKSLQDRCFGSTDEVTPLYTPFLRSDKKILYFGAVTGVNRTLHVERARSRNCRT